MRFFKHKTSIIDSNCKIGNDCKIWHWSHISKNSVIGAKSNIGQNVYIGENVKIGSNVKIQNNVSIYNGVTIQNDVFCGPSMVFTNVINPRSSVNRKDEYKQTLVKKGASIGANATIICGVTLVEYSFVGAGSVVTKSVKPHEMVAGVPAKRIGWLDERGNRISKPPLQK